MKRLFAEATWRLYEAYGFSRRYDQLSEESEEWVQLRREDVRNALKFPSVRASAKAWCEYMQARISEIQELIREVEGGQ